MGRILGTVLRRGEGALWHRELLGHLRATTRRCLPGRSRLPPRALPAEDELPAWQQLADRSAPKLQKVLTNRLDAENYKALMSSLDEVGRARLRSCGGPHASAWQQASPAAPGERLDDLDYVTTARALLGQGLAPAGAVCRNRART